MGAATAKPFVFKVKTVGTPMLRCVLNTHWKAKRPIKEIKTTLIFIANVFSIQRTESKSLNLLIFNCFYTKIK